MMHIYVMRHGIAHDRMAPDCPPDPDRALTEQGKTRTRLAARGLLAFRPTVDRRYTSPYLRAVETLDLCTEALGLEHTPRTVTDTLLPEADPDAFAALLREDRPRGALLAGHAPHVDLFVTWLLTGRRQDQTAMKKASVALLDVAPEVEPGEADLLWLIPPKALRALA